MLPWGRSMGCAGGHIGDTSGASLGVLARLDQVYQFRESLVRIVFLLGLTEAGQISCSIMMYQL